MVMGCSDAFWAMAVIGSNKLKNVIHVVIKNGAHETVGGGMSTVAVDIFMHPQTVETNSWQ